jgi:hypothetical protein
MAESDRLSRISRGDGGYGWLTGGKEGEEGCVGLDRWGYDSDSEEGAADTGGVGSCDPGGQYCVVRLPTAWADTLVVIFGV